MLLIANPIGMPDMGVEVVSLGAFCSSQLPAANYRRPRGIV